MKPKKPSMNSVRETKFTKALKGLSHLPNKKLVDKIDSKNFSLNANTAFRYRPDLLASEEYKRCLSLFERKLDYAAELPTSQAIASMQMGMQNLMNVMMNKEMMNKDSLEQLAVEIVRDLFDIPEHITLLPDLKMGFGSTDEQDDSPEPVLSLSLEEQRNMRDEIQKRVILNGLVHGSAMHIWKSAHYIIKEKIDEIDPLLMELYDTYTAAISWGMWQMDTDSALAEINSKGLTQGKNELKFEEEGEAHCDIECSGINFPVLLHEVTKGAMDYLICHGIPKEYNEEELTYYYAKADSYENEYWHYLLSPSLWVSFIEAANLSTQKVPLAIARLTELSYQELSSVMTECIDSPEEGNKKLKEFKII
jgi:hypothetical protein